MSAMLDFDNACEQQAGVPDESTFLTWISNTLQHAAPSTDKPFSIGVRIVDEEESAQLNQHYRHKDKPTNVLSFSADLPATVLDALDEIPLGDLAICAAVVLREAQEQNKDPAVHWAHMTVHGVLHLLGHDHEDPAQAELMESLERDILATWGIVDPYLSEQLSP